MSGNEIERYQARPPAEIERRTSVDGWVEVFRPIVELADHVRGTDFVPRGLRGNAPATAAAMLYGRELGIGPMRSLRSVHMVDGTPTLAAEQMRSMVLAAGHEIAFPERSKTRCVAQGRRKGSTVYTSVEWTIQDARDMNLATKPNWRKMPRQMLVARATAELCRLIFADVIGGAYATEEVADGDTLDLDAEPPELPAAPKRRTAQRKTPVKRQPQIEAPKDEEPVAPQPGPPLPNEQAAGNEVQDAEVVTDEDEHPDPDRQVTDAQLKRLHAMFTDHEIGDRDRKLHIARVITGRPDLQSSTHLTVREASQLIDTLAQLDSQAGDAFPEALEALLSEMQQYDDETSNETSDSTEDDQ